VEIFVRFLKGLFVNVWFAANIPKGSCGGVARSMRELSEGLRRVYGFRTEIVYGERGRIRGNYLFFACALCARLLMRAKDRPQWIIARSTDGIVCALVTKILKIKTKIALHNHGWEEIVYDIEKKLPRGLVNHPSTWKARAVRFPLLRACIFLCTRCLSGTVCETRWLANRYPLGRKKYAYLPNGVYVGREAFWEKQTLRETAFLAVGGATWKKNLENTTGIFKIVAEKLPDAKLVLVGTGMKIGYYSHELKALQDSYLIVPLENPDGMKQWYMHCPFFISSSRYEGGHSLAVLEALSFGCVVFAADIPSMREVIIDKSNGILIRGNSAKEDARIILDVLADKNLVARLRQNAFKTARRNTWDRQVKRLKTILCAK
jgi:glycosyltransferase involved in cell wall biosynthesis